MKTDRQEFFERASIPKAYFALTIPSVLGKIVMLLYNMADTWFIAATGDTQLVAGVALCGPIFTLMLAVGDIFGMGGSSVISAQAVADILSAAIAVWLVRKHVWSGLKTEKTVTEH